MSLAGNPDQWTPDAYLAFERRSDAKHELIDGRLVAMSGASRAHAALGARLSGLLYERLRAGGCQAFTSDLRVQAGEPGGIHSHTNGGSSGCDQLPGIGCA